MSFAEGTPTVEVTLDKPRTLGFTLGAMRRCRDLGVLTVNATDETAMMLALPEYVWSCLADKDRKELSVAAVSELMNPNNIKTIAEAVGELFQASQPKVDPEKNEGPAPVTKPSAGEKELTSIKSGQSESEKWDLLTKGSGA